MGEEREDERAEDAVAERARCVRSIWGRVASINLSYCTPDGQAVTQAMQPRQAVEVAAHLPRQRDRALGRQPHQLDTSTR